MKHVIKIQILCSLACFCMFLVGCKDQTTTAETNAKSSAQAETKSQSQKDLKMACLRTCSEKYRCQMTLFGLCMMSNVCKDK